MKSMLSASLLFIAAAAFGQQNAGEYLGSFSTSYSQIQQGMWDYTRTISHGKNARKVEKTRLALIASSDAALKQAQKADAFEGSTTYRDSVVAYFKIINLVLKEDYAQLVDMEEVAEQSYDLMEAYMLARELASDKQTEATKMIIEEQRKFAEQHNVTLLETSSDLDKKMEVASQVYDHYNEVYLIFFKSYKQELYLMDAIGRQDVNAIEQNREALKATVAEGREKLKNVKLYQSDNSVITASNELFDFYETEASKGMDVVLDYFLKSENFQKVKAGFDAKKEKDRTQADVDAYNKAVNEMNEAVNAYNAQNEKFNNQRGKLVDNWNKVAQNFTAKHVPKGR